MLNDPWIDPRGVDWTDALNPLRNPGWAKNNNRYVYDSLNEPYMMALRQAAGVEPRIYVGPDPVNQLIQPGVTQDYEVPIEPNYWVWAVTASPAAGADFLFNVTDSVTGATFFSSPASAATLNPNRNGTTGRGPLYYLPHPHLYLPPSYPIIRIVNTNASAQLCRVTLFGCVEYSL